MTQYAVASITQKANVKIIALHDLTLEPVVGGVFKFVGVRGSFITDENGYIKNEYSKDLIHLDHDNQFIQNYVESKIDELIREHSG